MIVLTLIFAAVFGLLLTSLVAYLAQQRSYLAQNIEGGRALQVAEAGMEYYRWRLSHFPEDIQDGTGGPGPYVKDYADPESSVFGQYSLEIGGKVQCGKVQVVEATSTGWTTENPNVQRVVTARIARPTVADYSYIVDSPVRVGADRIIIGPYHGNSLIRMEADNRSTVSSKVASSSCDLGGLGGCTSGSNAPGVYGTGLHPELWQFPASDISFTNFNFDFDEMEEIASTSGIFLGKDSDDVSRFGYQLVLKSNRTVDVYRVTSINWITSTLPSNVSVTLPELLGDPTTKRQFIANYPLPGACGLIYVEDRVWLQGVVAGPVTVVANDTDTPSPDIYLLNNITYSTTTENTGLTALAERHVLIPLYVPDNMELNGVFFAQTGAYGRNSYGNVSNINGVNYTARKQRSTLTTNGTVVSKLRTATKWVNNLGAFTQGFQQRYDYYDRTLAKSPPPLTPFTSPDFRYVGWYEIF